MPDMAAGEVMPIYMVILLLHLLFLAPFAAWAVLRYRRSIRRALRAWWFDLRWPESKESEGVCCCGSPVDSHGWGDGHSPVDMYHYHRDAYIHHGENKK